MKIFIGCSSSTDLKHEYYDIGKKVVNALCLNNDLVFGAYKYGTMGICYDTFKNANKEIIGIVPKTYEKDLTELECNISLVTNSVTERCKLLLEKSDIIVFLPGGIGTMSELFAALEEKRNGMDKPIIIYNELNLFDEVLKLLQYLEKEKFSTSQGLYELIDNVNDLVNYINKYENGRNQ